LWQAVGERRMQRALFPELEAAPLLLAGRFAVERTIGDGGMGIVFSARDLRLERDVAIKLLTCDVDGAALEHEARCLARIRHPNVVTLHDLIGSEYGPCLVMEMIAGCSARTWASEVWPWPEVVDVYRHAGEGLVAAHEAGVVHGDFKPDNVMIERSARRRSVKVLDFGIARIGTRSGSSRLAGTLGYLAPEQLPSRRSAHEPCGRMIDERADQFSFCVALWEALTGRLPFVGETAAGLLHAQANVNPTLAMLPTRLETILRRGLAFDPRARFASLAALLRELETMLEQRRR
jgi:serine/threonine protein kinase